MGILRYKTDWVSLYFEGKFKKVRVTVSFLPCFILYLGAISKYKSPGAYIRRGDLTEGFLHYDFGGLIFGGAYTWRGLFSEFYGIYKTVIYPYNNSKQEDQKSSPFPYSQRGLACREP